MPLSWTMDKLGPMARSAEDCQLVLGAIAGADPDDPSSVSAPADLKASPVAREFKLGIVRPASPVWPDEEAHLAFEDALRLLARLGCRIDEAKLPDLPFEEVASIVIESESVAAFRSLLTSETKSQLLGNGARVALPASRAISGADYVRAMQARRIMQQELDKLFGKFDLLVAPAADFVATPLDADLGRAFSEGDPLGAAGNLAGLPALSVPCGFTRADCRSECRSSAGLSRSAAFSRSDGSTRAGRTGRRSGRRALRRPSPRPRAKPLALRELRFLRVLAPQIVRSFVTFVVPPVGPNRL